MLVSIIIPVYNVEKYLKKSLESVSNQTYNDLEIILVDDGSTDSSGEICDKFAEINSKARVIHKENGGLSSARNTGIKVAKGDYIAFLDSDDFLAVNYIETSLHLCDKYNAQISIMGMVYIGESVNQEIVDKEKKNKIMVLGKGDAIKESLYQKHFSCCAPGKLYRKEVFEGIEFPLNRLSEDLAVCHLILNNADTIVFSSQNGYYYRQHNNSIMHTFNQRRLDALIWTNKIEQFCTVTYPLLVSAAKCRSFNVAVHLALDLPHIKEENHDYYKTIWKEIVRTRNAVIMTGECRFREKAAAIISYFGINVLRTVWNSKFSVKNDGN